MKRNLPRSWRWTSLLTLAAAMGCGSDGPQRYQLSGTVTFEGEPVPSGMVAFEPEQTGIGGGFAPIVNGRYDTEVTGRGHLGGRHTVQITGFKGVGDPSDPDAAAIPMFKPYQLTVDLPKETGTMDFPLPMDNVNQTSAQKQP